MKTCNFPSLQDEFQFRLSLVRLMTVPHQSSATASAPKQLEELAVLASKKQQGK